MHVEVHADEVHLARPVHIRFLSLLIESDWFFISWYCGHV
jgi:hypothetical protein